MSQYKQEIMNYGEDVTDFESSPFEGLRMLHDRTELHKIQDQLDYDEKVLLASYDLKLIENAKKLVQHISNIYDFNLSKEIPFEQWWWHLDKIANGDMSFGISAEISKVI